MNASYPVLMFSIYKLPLLFKPSKEGDAAIYLDCKAEVPWGRWWSLFLMELGEMWDQPWKSLHHAEDCSCARAALKVGHAFRWFLHWKWKRPFSPLLVKIKLFASGEGRERLFFLSLSHLPGHQFVSGAPQSLTVTLVLNSCGSLYPTLFLGALARCGCYAFGNVQELRVIAGKVVVVWRKQREGGKIPLFFFPLWETGMDVCRHNLQEQKLWVRNVERSLMEGGSAFCAVLSSDHLIFCLCSAQNEMKEKMRTSNLQLLIVCMHLVSCTFWRGLWLVRGEGIYWLISCAQMHSPSLSYKHLHSWCKNKSSLD